MQFCPAKRTQVPVGTATFDLNRCNESPLPGENPDFWHVSKFNTGSLPLHGILPVKSVELSTVSLVSQAAENLLQRRISLVFGKVMVQEMQLQHWEYCIEGTWNNNKVQEMQLQHWEYCIEGTWTNNKVQEMQLQHWEYCIEGTWNNNKVYVCGAMKKILIVYTGQWTKLMMMLKNTGVDCSDRQLIWNPHTEWVS